MTNLTNRQKLELYKEAQRRKKEETYKQNFSLFCKEQVSIITKDASKGYQPFKFNRAQEIINSAIEGQLKDKGKVRVIILKGRQMGMSTYSVARVFWKSFLSANQSSVVMAHDTTTSDTLFKASKNLIERMSPDIKPSLKRSNAKEIQFAHNESGYRLYTAGAAESGRGTTPTICHLSEVAFWTNDSKILAGLFQGISESPGTEVILESTANGVGNEFHRLWTGATRGENDYLPIFVPWFLMPEYQRTTPKNFELDEEEKQYQSLHKLTPEQMYWRRLKIAESGDLKFRQEYPATPEEAFVTSGSNVFDVSKLDQYIPEVAKATREWDDTSKYFIDKPKAHLEIFQHPKYDETFLIGADTSLGVGRDYQCAVVMNSKREVVGLFRDNRIDPAKFGEVLFYLGRHFNNALIAVESNSMGIATLNTLQQMEYQNLYKQTKTANVSQEEGTRLGFRTTIATKGVLIGHLKNAIENFDVKIPSSYMLHELKMFVSFDNGKVGATNGETDDTVIALGIALEVLRTHGLKLTNNKVPWAQKSSSYTSPEFIWL